MLTPLLMMEKKKKVKVEESAAMKFCRRKRVETTRLGRAWRLDGLEPLIGGNFFQRSFVLEHNASQSSIDDVFDLNEALSTLAGAGTGTPSNAE
jgi:hypothetical protein